MPRKPSVNYWASRKGYGCWFQGEQVILATGPDDSPTGPTYLAALDKFKEMLSLATADRTQQDTTVATVCELYARHLEAEGRLKSLKLFKDGCASAVER